MTHLRNEVGVRTTEPGVDIETSPGTFSWVMSGLRDGGHIVETGNGRGLKRRPRTLVKRRRTRAPWHSG